jgi:hypothetical protein
MRLLAYKLICLALFAFSCTESKQTGSTPVKKQQPVPVVPAGEPTDPLGDPGDPVDPDGEEGDCDPDQDFAKLDFPEDVTNCKKEDKMYNFDTEKCTSMYTSPFKCDYKSVRAALKSLELSDSDLRDQEDAGLKLIGCGSTNNGFTIVTQHWQKSKKADINDCSYNKQGKVVSVCFKRYTGESPPALPTDEEGKKDFVAGCMKQ